MQKLNKKYELLKTIIIDTQTCLTILDKSRHCSMQTKYHTVSICIILHSTQKQNMFYKTARVHYVQLSKSKKKLILKQKKATKQKLGVQFNA